MRQRTEPRTIGTGWPYVQARGPDGRACTLLIRGGPVERGALLEWAVTQITETRTAFGAAVAEVEALLKAEPVDSEALASASKRVTEAQTKAAEAAEGVAGWLVTWAWYDRDRDLDARARWDRGEFTGPDARLLAGRACVEELLADGWAWEWILDVATGIQRLLRTGRPDAQDVMEVRPFSAAPTSPTG